MSIYIHTRKIGVLFEVGHAIKANKKGVQKAFWLRTKWERCDLAATNVWSVAASWSHWCMANLAWRSEPARDLPCNQGFWKSIEAWQVWRMMPCSNATSAALQVTLCISQLAKIKQTNGTNPIRGHLSQSGGQMLHQGWHTCWDFARLSSHLSHAYYQNISKISDICCLESSIKQHQSDGF